MSKLITQFFLEMRKLSINNNKKTRSQGPDLITYLSIYQSDNINPKTISNSHNYQSSFNILVVVVKYLTNSSDDNN